MTIFQYLQLKTRVCKIPILAVGMCFLSFIVIALYEYQRGYIIQGIKIIFEPSEEVAKVKKPATFHELFLAPWTGRSLKPLFKDMSPFTLQKKIVASNSMGNIVASKLIKLCLTQNQNRHIAWLHDMSVEGSDGQSDYDFLQHHITSAGLNLTRMAQLKISYKPLDLETELLADPPLMDPLSIPNETFSQVYLLDSRPEYTIGHTVTVRVDVRDGYGHQLRRGGDDVYVWVVETEKNASMAVEVTDLRNGTYMARVPIAWTGLQAVRVSIRYPREAIRALLHTRHVMKSLRYVAAGYIGARASESTLCLPFPRVPGYKSLCNFTRRNHGQSWYCGMPRKPSLTCSDWTMLRDLEFPKPLPLTAAEEVTFMNFLLPPLPRLVQQQIFLPVTSGHHQAPPPCDKHNFTHTWFDPAPRGFFIHGTWVPTACSVPPPHSEMWIDCLTDTHIVMAGDSNLLMWFQHVKKRIQCIENRLRHDALWHTPLTCVRDDIKFSMTWQLHGYPEHPNSNHWAQLVDFRSACERIDGIPSVGRYIVIVHLYIHFTIHHYSVFIDRLKCVRRAVENLLARNPSSKIMIRAPHTAYKGWNPIFGGDMAVKMYVDLLRREFRGLYSKIVFLNTWDMTVAGENTDYHPDDWIDQQMINYALGHACNR